MPHRTVMSMRSPVGVAALIVSFNTPLPNYAWKISLPCLRQRRRPEAVGAHAGLGRVLRSSCAAAFSRRASSTSCTGSGERQAPPLVEHPDVDLVSFTGSAATGRWINETCSAPAREGLPRARREERAGRLRRRRPRSGRRVVARVRVLQRGPALCRGESHGRVRLRLRRVPRTVRRGRTRLRDGPGDQRGEPRADSRRARRREGGAAASASTAPAGGLRRRSSKSAGRCRAFLHRAVRPCGDPLSGPRSRRSDRTRQRLAVRVDVRDPHGEPASRDALRRGGRSRGRRRERRHARKRAAHGLRRREAVGDGLAGSRRRGARRLHGVEVRQPDRRSGRET